MKITKAITAITLLTALSLATLPAKAEENKQGETRWLRVHVVSHEDQAVVDVKLPLTLAVTAIRAVNTEELKNGKVKLPVENADINWVQLIQALRESPGGEWVTVKSPEADVKMNKTKDMILIHVDARGEEKAIVDVKLPIDLLEVLKVTEDNEIDLQQLLEKLSSLPGGDIVVVKAEDADVRVWIE